MKNCLLYSTKYIYLFFALLFCTSGHGQIKAPAIPLQNKTSVAEWSHYSENFPGNIKAFEENSGQYTNPFNDEKV